MTRIVIIGGPRTGKTALAAELARSPGDMHGAAVYHTDDVIAMGWSEASAEVSRWFGSNGTREDWIVEGVAAVRALRKWLNDHSTGTPCDVVIFCLTAHEELTPKQQSAWKGVQTVFDQIEQPLRDCGVRIEYR